MLFDLRGRGRRNTVRVIYASLAILMGGGLVLFGVGSDVGGIFSNAGQGGGGGNANDVFKKRVEKLEKRVKVNPSDADAWKELARARFQAAGTDVADDGSYSDEGTAKLRSAGAAWDKYLALEPAAPDRDVAAVMVRVYQVLGESDKAVSTQEIILEATKPPTTEAYQQLAALAYLAGQSRKGDLASKKAIELAPKDEKNIVKDRLNQYKTQAATQAIQQAQTPATTP